MDASDTSSVLWVIVQNDRLIYEKAYAMESKYFFTQHCHSITLKMQNKFFWTGTNNGKEPLHSYQKRM